MSFGANVPSAFDGEVLQVAVVDTVAPSSIFSLSTLNRLPAPGWCPGHRPS